MINRKFKNRVVPDSMFEQSFTESHEEKIQETDHEKELEVGSFSGIENVGVDKKQVLYRSSINTPPQSRARTATFIVLAILSLSLLTVALVLSIVFGVEFTKTPLIHDSCVTGASPGALLRDYRMRQILIEYFSNEGVPYPIVNSTEYIALQQYFSGYSSRIGNQKKALQNLLTNSQSSMFTQLMYQNYVDQSNPFIIPITSDTSNLEFTNTYKKNVSMSEITQEMIYHAEQMLKLDDSGLNKTTTSYSLMYIFLNRRTAADAYLLFCRNYQESETARLTAIDRILQIYLLVSTCVYIVLMLIFLLFARLEMMTFHKVVNLFKHIPKDVTGVVYRTIEKKTTDDLKHLKRNPVLQPKTLNLILGCFVIVILSVCIGLMYYETSLNSRTSSQAMLVIDYASILLRTTHRITIRMNELFAFLSLPSGKAINNAALGTSSNLNTYRTEIRGFIADINSLYNVIVYGSNRSESLIGKYTNVDEEIKGPSNCTDQSVMTCSNLQKLLSFYTVQAGEMSEKFFNPLFAKSNTALLSYLRIFNLNDLVFERLDKFLDLIVQNTSISSKTITISCFVIGVILLGILHFIMFNSYNNYNNQLAHMRSLLNYIPLEHLESNEILRNYALYNSLSNTNSSKGEDDSMKNLLNSMVDGSVLANEKGEILLFNSAAQKLFGKTPADVVGLLIYTLFDPSHETQLRKAVAEYQRALRETESKHSDLFELECVRKNQTKFPANVNLFVTRNGTGAVLISCFIKDITPEKKQHTLLEEEKRNSDNLLRNILPDAVASKLKNLQASGNVTTFIAEKFSDITCFFSDM